MSVYKFSNPLFFQEALLSIWDQQTLKATQIVLVKDGPITAELNKIIDNWKVKLGEALTIVSLPRNMGLANALNSGLKLCRYDLVARMDSDDLSLPDRFKKQISYLSSHLDIDICGTQIQERSNDLKKIVLNKILPTEDDDLKNYLKYRSPFNHPTVIFRKKAVLSVGGYPEIYPEDYMLWIKLAIHNYKFHNLDSCELFMRVEDALSSRRGLNFIKGELKTFLFMYTHNIINLRVLVFNCMSRIFLRVIPSCLRFKIYKRFR